MLKILFFALVVISSAFAGTKDYYEFKWLVPEKKVFVLQDKLYENEKKIYVNLGYGFQSLSQFQDTTNFHLGLGYYFKEEWGVEFFTHIYRNKNNSAYDAVQNPSSSGATSVLPFILRVKNAYGLMAIYSPFYAKLNTYNLIYYIDWSFGLGVAKLSAEDNYRAFTNNNVALGYETVNKTAITAKTQVSFHLSERWSFNIDFYNYWVKARQPNGGSEKYIRYDDWIFSAGMNF